MGVPFALAVYELNGLVAPTAVAVIGCTEWPIAYKLCRIAASAAVTVNSTFQV